MESRAASSARGIVPILLAGLALGAGCDGGEDGGRPTFNPLVVVADREDGTPQAGVKLVLMDAAANRPVRGPAVTDSTGWHLFRGVPAGRYAVLAFPDGDRAVHSTPGPFDLPRPGKDAAAAPAGLLAPLADHDPHISVHVFTHHRPDLADPRPSVAGRIVDAATGGTLAAAFVSVAADIGAYLDLYAAADDVSDAEGAFAAGQVGFEIEPASGWWVQTEPLIVTREGYAPRTWRAEPLPPDHPLVLTGVEIALTALAEEDTGVLTGSVLLDGVPAAGVPVGLACVGGEEGAPGKGNVGVPDRVATSDDAGVFAFAGLPAGRYAVRPGFLPGDGFVGNLQPAGGAAVEPPAATALDPIAVRREILPLQPFHGGLVAAPLAALRWSAVAGADSYEVRLDRGILGTTADTEMPIPAGHHLAPGDHTWYVEAFTTGGAVVGLADRPFLFTLETYGTR
jgi:hypothetical protein